MMKAVYIKEHGGADKLIYGERPIPKLGPDDVLVRVKACALNHLDIWVRQGLPGVTIPLPRILGSDIAGVVEKAGPNVRQVDVGQKVMAAPGVSCGRCNECLLGHDHLCSRYDILGQLRDGGYAEYVAVPAANLIDYPGRLSFEEAAAFPLTFLTAWHLLVSLAKIRAEETILIHAGGSGLGIAAIQIAKLWNAVVYTTVGSDEKAAKAKRLGADHVINYNKKDFVAEIRDLTNRRGVDVALDSIGQATFDKTLLCLAKSGRMLACGTTSGREAKFDLRALFSRNITVYGARMGTRTDLQEAAKFVNTHQLEPVIDKTFPLKKAAEAHQYMEDRKNFGKIVLTI